MAEGKIHVCTECPAEQHFTWPDYARHMRSVHGVVARLTLTRQLEEPPKVVAFRPRITGECGVCHAERSQAQLGVCRECGGQFCGDHILDHPCPLPGLVV